MFPFNKEYQHRAKPAPLNWQKMPPFTLLRWIKDFCILRVNMTPTTVPPFTIVIHSSSGDRLRGRMCVVLRLSHSASCGKTANVGISLVGDCRCVIKEEFPWWHNDWLWKDYYQNLAQLYYCYHYINNNIFLYNDKIGIFFYHSIQSHIWNTNHRYF